MSCMWPRVGIVADGRVFWDLRAISAKNVSGNAPDDCVVGGFGVGVAAVLDGGARCCARRAANQAWVALRYHIDHQLRAAMTRR